MSLCFKALLRPSTARRLCGAWAGLVVLFAAAAVPAAEFQRTFTFTGDDLEVAAMIGAVTVVAAAGDAFEVTVAIRGADASEDLVEFVEAKGTAAKLAVRFPLEDHDRYVYPELGRSKTTITFGDENSHESSWLKKVFGGLSGEKITVSGSGKGLEMWADVTIAVPTAAGLRVRHGVGAIEARGVTGELDLDTHAGAITVRDGTGDLRLDTGSGSVRVASVRGGVSVDTGSGAVELEDVEGDKIQVDTASGGVEAVALTCENLMIDTGSGRVVVRGVSAERAEIDTGSGGVTLQLDRMGHGRFVVDTGSGGIELELPSDASARIDADTGSGQIRVDVEGATIEHNEDDELRMTVGDGDARVTLDAGSGSITVKSR